MTPALPPWLACAAAGCLLLPACDTATDLPTDYIYDPEPPPAAEMDLEEIAEAALEMMDLVAAIGPEAPLAVYDEMLVEGDASCPVVQDFSDTGYSLLYWQNNCQSFGGAQFAGTAQRIEYLGFMTEAGPLYGEALFLEGAMRSSRGATLVGAGSVFDQNYVSEGVEVWNRAVQGRFVYDGAMDQESWLGDDFAPSFTVSMGLYDELGRYAIVTGGLSGLSGPIDTVVMDDIVLIEQGLGSSCPIEPAGAISLRDANGDWYDVLFDGPSNLETITPPELCDGCGEVFFRGESLGDACIDFTPLLEWESQPW